MKPDFNLSDISRQFREDCRQQGQDFDAALTALHQRSEVLLDLYCPDRAERLACQAGCRDCCILNVSVLWPEALRIVRYLEETAKFESESFFARLDQIWARISGISEDERVYLRQDCAFLGPAGRCSIYPVRPILCRGVTSTDAASCRKSLRENLFGGGDSVEMNLFQHEIYQTAFLELSRELEEAGMDGRGFELTGLVRFLFQSPQHRTEFMSGLHLQWRDL